MEIHNSVRYIPPVGKKKSIEPGMIFECRKDTPMNFRIKGKNSEKHRSSIVSKMVVQGTRIRVDEILETFPRIVVFQISIANPDTSIETLDVRYPIGLFQEQFRHIILGDDIKLLCYTKKS